MTRLGVGKRGCGWREIETFTKVECCWTLACKKTVDAVLPCHNLPRELDITNLPAHPLFDLGFNRISKGKIQEVGL